VPSLSDVLAGLEPIIPGLVVAGIFMLMLLALRSVARTKALRKRLSVPSSLLVVYVITSVLAGFAPLYWPAAHPVLYAVSLLVLALAVILALAVAAFDLFLARYRRITVPRIARDIVIAVVYMVAVFTVLSQVGLNVTSLITTSAVLTAVIGFALQDLLSSVMSGIALQLEQPFAVGDWVMFDQQEGRVLETNWRATKIETNHRDIVVIPNNVITRSPLINFSAPDPIHRQTIRIGLAYDAPPNRVKRSILTALHSVEEVLKEPAPYLFTRKFDDHAITYRIHFFINDIPRKDHIEDAVLSRIWYQLKRDGLQVPFPTRDINMYEVRAEDRQREQEVENGRVEDALSGVPFLEPLDPDERRQLARQISRQSFASDETIIRHGDPGESFYIVASGRLSVTTQRGVEVAILGRGDYFGEMSLMTGEARSATVAALEDTELYVVDKASFERIIKTHTELVEQIATRLSERRRALSEQDSRTDLATVAPSDSGIVHRIRRFFNMTG
jgi:small-conductance mechanosensitive channel/CRP-like cAMP-binding protein